MLHSSYEGYLVGASVVWDISKAKVKKLSIISWFTSSDQSCFRFQLLRYSWKGLRENDELRMENQTTAAAAVNTGGFRFSHQLGVQGSRFPLQCSGILCVEECVDTFLMQRWLRTNTAWTLLNFAALTEVAPKNLIPHSVLRQNIQHQGRQKRRYVDLTLAFWPECLFASFQTRFGTSDYQRRETGASWRSEFAS